VSGSISTIEDILPRLQEIANGEKTVFSADFSFISSEFVLVYLGEEKQTSGYTVDVTANTVTFATPPASNTVVTIVRAVPLNWEVSDSGNNRGAMDKDAFDRVFSLLVGKMQTLKEELSRCVKTPISSDKNGEQVSEFFLAQLADALTVLSQAQDVLALIQSTSSSALASINSALETALSQIQVQVQRASDFADSAEASANLAQTTVNNALGDIEDALNEALAQLNLGLYYTKEEANGTFVALQGNQTISGNKTFNDLTKFRSNLSPSTSSSKENIIEDTLIQASTNTEGNVDGMYVSRVQDKGGNREVQYRGGFYAPTAQVNRWPAIALGVTSGEIPYSNLKVDKAYAPTPSANSSTSEKLIATTGWVNDPDKSTNVVHRTGNETITGTKVLNGSIPIKLNKAGNTYTEIQYTSDGSTRLGGLRNIREGNTDNMQMYVASKDGSTILGSIQINRDDNNGILAAAPHPAASTNYSNQAIMTAGRAADPKQNFNLLHRSGDETFSGVKTGQSNNPRFGFKHTEIDVTTAPAEQKSTRIFFSDKNNKWISEIGVYKNTDDEVLSQITANNDTAGVARLQIICKKDGSKYGTCPTPPDPADSSAKIATTAWVNRRITSIMNSKLQVVDKLPSSPNADTFYFIPEK
jgi:hypothetical protein